MLEVNHHDWFFEKKRNLFDDYYILPENNLAYNFFSHLRERGLDSGFHGYLDQQKNTVHKALGSISSNTNFFHYFAKLWCGNLQHPDGRRYFKKIEFFFVNEKSFTTTGSIVWYLTIRASRRFFVSLSQPRYYISRVRFWLAVDSV